jgi:hypothetical protein
MNARIGFVCKTCYALPRLFSAFFICLHEQDEGAAAQAAGEAEADVDSFKATIAEIEDEAEKLKALQERQKEIDSVPGDARVCFVGILCDAPSS